MEVRWGWWHPGVFRRAGDVTPREQLLSTPTAIPINGTHTHKPLMISREVLNCGWVGVKSLKLNLNFSTSFLLHMFMWHI